MNSMILVPQAEIEQLQKVDTLAKTTRQALIDHRNDQFASALIQARAIKTLSDLITPAMLQDVKALMDTPLGFRTDRAPGSETHKKYGAYKDDTIKQTLIVATLSGFRHVNNEWNIIAGNFYACKNGLERQISEFPGLTDLHVELGVPLLKGDRGALVPAKASWKLDGRPDAIKCVESPEIDLRIPIRVNSSMGTDAILGKAKRKLYAKILERLTGTTISTVDDATDTTADVIDVEPTPTETDETKLAQMETLLKAATTLRECIDLAKAYDFASEDAEMQAAAMVDERKAEIKGS